MNLISRGRIKKGNYYQIVLNGSSIKSIVYIINSNIHLYISFFPHDLEVKVLGNSNLPHHYEFSIISKYSFNRIKRLITNYINKL